jgi:hypothetical protein
MQFKTEVLGVQMEVTGEFFEGAFDIHTIEHKGESLDFYDMQEHVLDHVAETALKELASAAMEVEDDLGR